MGKNKNKKAKSKKSNALSGVAPTTSHPLVATLTEGGLLLLAAVAAGGAGAALGKHSLIAGVPVTLFGIHKKNKYLIAAGLGLTLSNGFQRSVAGETKQGVDGFDLKQIATQAKDRVGTFFKNFSEKLYMPAKSDQQTAGLSGEDQVTYFVNPYNSGGEIDMSAIDRIQEQIAEMNKGTSGLNEVEREF